MELLLWLQLVSAQFELVFPDQNGFAVGCSFPSIENIPEFGQLPADPLGRGWTRSSITLGERRSWFSVGRYLIALMRFSPHRGDEYVELVRGEPIYQIRPPVGDERSYLVPRARSAALCFKGDRCEGKLTRRCACTTRRHDATVGLARVVRDEGEWLELETPLELAAYSHHNAPDWYGTIHDDMAVFVGNAAWTNLEFRFWVHVASIRRGIDRRIDSSPRFNFSQAVLAAMRTPWQHNWTPRLPWGCPPFPKLDVYPEREDPCPHRIQLVDVPPMERIAWLYPGTTVYSPDGSYLGRTLEYQQLGPQWSFTPTLACYEAAPRRDDYDSQMWFDRSDGVDELELAEVNAQFRSRMDAVCRWPGRKNCTSVERQAWLQPMAEPSVLLLCVPPKDVVGVLHTETTDFERALVPTTPPCGLWKVPPWEGALDDASHSRAP